MRRVNQLLIMNVTVWSFGLAPEAYKIRLKDHAHGYKTIEVIRQYFVGMGSSNVLYTRKIHEKNS
jgi:hypothetical protein